MAHFLMLSLIIDFLGRTSYWFIFWNLHFQVYIKYCINCILIHLSFSIMWGIFYSYILFKRFFNSSLEGISTLQWQGFICSRICTKKIGFFHPSDRASSVEESTSVKLSLSNKNSDFSRRNFSTPVAGLHLFKNLFCQPTILHQENRIFPPQWQGFICSRIYFCQAITLHQENRIFPTQWQGFICSRIFSDIV